MFKVRKSMVHGYLNGRDDPYNPIWNLRSECAPSAGSEEGHHAPKRTQHLLSPTPSELPSRSKQIPLKLSAFLVKTLQIDFPKLQ